MTFSPRLNSNGIYNNKWWYSTENVYYPSYQLPNCTCYCYGRYAEILGKFYKLPNANGGDWYRLATNFNRGKTPKLGAIACWYSPNGRYAGHVAVVEEIKANGDIVTSNSGYYRPIQSYPPSTTNYFWIETCVKAQGYRSSWEISRGYQLAGFIYLDGDPVEPTPTEWVKGNRYLTDDEMRNNGYIVYSYLTSKGWSFNAICGVLGNMQNESKVNPGIWQNLYPHPSNGYGLVQWTPSTVITSWLTSNHYALDDGYAQLLWIDTETVPQGQWIETSEFRITFEEFKKSTQSPEWCATCFQYNFERGTTPAIVELKRKYAKEWAEFLKGLDPFNPDPTPQEKVNKMPVWMKIRYF